MQVYHGLVKNARGKQVEIYKILYPRLCILHKLFYVSLVIQPRRFLIDSIWKSW